MEQFIKHRIADARFGNSRKPDSDRVRTIAALLWTWGVGSAPPS